MQPRFYLPLFLLFFYSCSETPEEKTTETRKTDEKPITGFHNGDNCFEFYGLGGQGYLHFDIVGKDFTCTLYGYNEVWGNVYYVFKGVMQGDSMLVSMHQIPEDIDLVWKILIADDGQIRIFGLPTNPGMIEINPIDCVELPDIKKDGYSSVEEIAKEEEAEATENISYECFYKYYNTPGGRTTQAEYLKIDFLDEDLKGMGAGYLEGEGEWKMTFTGFSIDDTTYRIEANYVHILNTTSSYKTTEIWYINHEHSGVTIKKISSNEYRQPGKIPFHRIDCADIDGWAVRLMKGE